MNRNGEEDNKEKRDNGNIQKYIQITGIHKNTNR
jgi:hypothetical protein